MKKFYLLFSKALLCLLILSSSALAQNKGVYLPNSFYVNANNWSDDYCLLTWDPITKKYTSTPSTNIPTDGVLTFENLTDDRCRWSKNRSIQTKDIILMYEPGFGNDPYNAKKAGGGTMNLYTALNATQEYFEYYANEMKMIDHDGKYSSKYKLLILLSHTTTWMAYGSGYDDTIGAMWVNEAALAGGGRTMAHELFHAFSLQVYADRTTNEIRAFQDAKNGPFWERSANHAACQIPGMETLNQNDPGRYLKSSFSHYLDTRKHYTTSYFLEHLRDSFQTKEVLAKLWRNNKTNEHPMQTASRLLFENDWDAMNNFICKTAMKNVIWNYAAGSNGWSMKSYIQKISYNTNATANIDPYALVMKKPRTILYAVDYNNRQFAIRDCMAPQDFGYNIIQLFPEKINNDGSSDIKIHFKGHISTKFNSYSGWRWGIVATKGNNMNLATARYSPIYSENDKTIAFHTEKNESLYLVVTGAPTKFHATHHYSWEAGFSKYFRYPYEVRFENALPMGYEPNFEETSPRYEGQGGNYHTNPDGTKGGWVAITAKVAPSVYISPTAKVLNYAQISDNVRLENFAVAKGKATISGNAVIKENAMVFSNANIYGNAVISGCAMVFNNAEIYDNAFITDNAFIYNTQVFDNAIACGNLWQIEGGKQFQLSGTCIAGGNGESLEGTSGTYLLYPEQSNNGRSAKDGLGNLSVIMLDSLKNNWNNISIRYSILSSTHNSNSEVNPAYPYFSIEEMAFGEITETSLEYISSEALSIHGREGSIYIEGAKEGEEIIVCNNEGQLFYRTPAKYGINTISGLSGGIVYIVKVGNQKAKKILWFD